MNWLAFSIGIFVGVNVGILIMGILSCSGKRIPRQTHICEEEK